MKEPKLPVPIAPGCTEHTVVLVALSGGADSVALLLLMDEALKAGHIGGLAAAHFHHGIRGETADRDFDFSRGLCERLGVPFFSEQGDVPAYAECTGKSTETAARELRYAFLERARTEAKADVIAVAHHMDDQAETVLMHLIRGTGTKGLAGMSERTGKLIRPLLGAAHAELTAYLEAHGEAWCEDETNAVPDASRNRLRLEIIPEIGKLNPGFAEAAARLAKHVREDEEYFAPLVRELLERAERPDGYDSGTLIKAPLPVRRRALRAVVSELLGNDYTEKDIGKLGSLLEGQSGRTVSFRGGHSARRDGALIVIDPVKEKRLPEMPLTAEEPLDYGSWRITLARTERFERPADAFTACIADEGLPLTVRFPEPGDRFTPLGLGGSRLVSDIFTDRKVPQKDRRVPLVLSGGDIVFFPGYTVSERVRVNDKTKGIVRIAVRKR